MNRRDMEIVPYKESFPPVIREGVRVLVLGSLPGDESLRKREYYGHQRNAFWYIMGNLFGFSPGEPYETRLALMLDHGVALWDVLASAVRPGSLDMKITSPRVNDIPALLERYPTVTTICCNGGTSHQYLKRFFPSVFDPPLQVYRLPSTSPAAAMMTRDQKLDVYRSIILPAL